MLTFNKLSHVYFLSIFAVGFVVFESAYVWIRSKLSPWRIHELFHFDTPFHLFHYVIVVQNRESVK